ncbi:MAG: M24 family metallopeptidase [Hyphomonadaceae bacterium]
MWFKTRGFSDSELDRFRELQRLSFSILLDEARRLEPGMIERDVAHRLVLAYRREGVKSFFHLPVVLFGERTALPGDWPAGKFFPKKRAVAENEAVIFDASPVFGDYLVDTSFSFCLGTSAAHATMMQSLAEFRRSVPEFVNQGATFQTAAAEVERRITELGYEAVHCKHPGEVLGHRAVRLPRLPFVWRTDGFDALSLSWFYGNEFASRAHLARSPLWNTTRTSKHKPFDGLWLVEPHAGDGPTGAKWEEILIIEGGKARWLDDEPPHVKQWKLIAEGSDYGPRALAA